MKRTLIYGAAALGLLFTSCSADNLAESDLNLPVDRDQTLYVSMAIAGEGVDALSRGASENGNPDADTDFENGEGDENAINNVYFVFYDNAGNVVGNIVSVDFNEWEENSEIKNETVEKTYSSVIEISLKTGEIKPSQVICYINPISPGTLNRNLDQIQTVARSTPFTTVSQNGTDVKRFAMSNSVHYHTTADGTKLSIATEIPNDRLRTTEAAAQNDLKNGDAVSIYVERYATKLSFSAVAPTTYNTATRVYKADGTYETKTVDLDFIPQYWALNAEAKTTYVIKSFREETASGLILADNYGYDALNNIINKNLTGNQQWQWNNAAYHRSYWGMSPAYYTSEYPEVSSDLAGITDIKQNYIPYNKLNEVGFSADVTAPQYFKETTVGVNALTSANPDAAVAHVIYVGRYNLTLDGESIAAGVANGTNKDDSQNPSFYTYMSGPVDGVDGDRPYIYFDNENGSAASKVEGGESMLKRFFAQTTILYKKQKDENNNDVYVRYTISNADDLAKLTSALKVSEVSKEVKENYNKINNTTEGAENAPVLKLQNNTRTLQFKNVESAEGIYILTGDGYRSLSKNPEGEDQVSLLEANITLMRQVGYSYYYTLGHAYFNIPVKHFGWYRAGNTQKNENNIDWNLVRVGDFGMVRNHSYTINVSQIIGLAKGIGDDNNPIVPPHNDEKYYMAYSVKILKWAVVPTQDVKL